MHVYSLSVTTAVFVLCAEEIEKRLAAYRRGSKIWRMMIFCQVREKPSQHTKMTRNETVSAPSESAVSVGIILHCGLSLMLCVQMDRNSQLCLSQFRGQHYWPSVSLSLMLCKVSHVSFSVAGRAGAPVPAEE